MIDEKAFQAALRTWSPNWPPFEPTERHLRKVFDAYEQARERVAVWTRDQLIAVYMDAFPTLFSSRYDIEEGGCTSRDIDRIVASLNKLFGPPAPVASVQDGDEPSKLIVDTLRTERARADSLERDLAAERAAHEETKADRDATEFGRQSGISALQAAEKRAAELKRERDEHRECVALARCEPNPPYEPIMSFEEWLGEMAEQGPDDLLGNWPRQAKMALEEMAKCLEDERASNADQFARIGELEREVAERESDARLHYASWVTAVNTIYATNVALGKPAPDTTDNPVQLATELQAELAALKAKLDRLFAWAERHAERDTPAGTKQRGYHDAACEVYGMLTLAQESAKPAEPKAGDDSTNEGVSECTRNQSRNTTDSSQSQKTPSASVDSAAAPCGGRTGSHPAAGTRTASTRASSAATSNGSTASTPEPKPDDEHRCKIDAPAYLNKCECGATLNDLFDKHRIAKPAEPEPGDVLSGEAAKAYMLANPGRRVRDSRWQRSWYAAVDGFIKIGDGVHTWGPADAFHGDMKEYEHARYIVLPPEPAKPATPDLDLAGRVRCTCGHDADGSECEAHPEYSGQSMELVGFDEPTLVDLAGRVGRLERAMRELLRVHLVGDGHHEVYRLELQALEGGD